MSDVFLSYAHEDQKLAERLATRLEREGWTVWWDRAIPVGRDFDRTIEEELDSASCVVVIWSRWSVQSEYVRDEAQVALDRGRLVPIAVGGAQPPLGFRRRQLLVLADAWGELEAVVTAVAEMVSRPVSERPRERAAARRLRIGLFKILLGATIAVPALLIGLGAGANARRWPPARESPLCSPRFVRTRRASSSWCASSTSRWRTRAARRASLALARLVGDGGPRQP